MTITVFFARFFGLYLIIGSLVYITRRQLILKALSQVFKQEAILLLSGLINLLLGLAVVVGHPIWVAGWPVLITLLGYLILLKGCFRLFVPPQTDARFVLRVLQGDNPMYISLVALLLGLLFTYEGFFG